MKKITQINIRMSLEDLRKVDLIMVNMRDRGLIGRLSRAAVVQVLLDRAYNFVLKTNEDKK